jgi:arylsulfatase A-like enzyme
VSLIGRQPRPRGGYDARRLQRRILRFLHVLLTAPPVVGAAYLLGLAAWAGQRASEDDSDLGDVRRAEAVATFIERRFASEIGRMKIGIVAAAIALGIVLGLVAEVLLRARNPRPRLMRRSFAGAFVESALLVAALHAMLVLWAMADSPQLYAARWYAKGGLPRTIQIFATDVLGPKGIVVLAILLAIAWVRPTRISYLVRRALGFFRGPVRKRLALAGIPLGLLLFLRASDAPIPRIEPIAIAQAKAPERMNVLVLAADSLRADRLDPKIAPNLAALAAKGTRFDRAYVSIPRTFPSWVTILTGRHGHHHGIRSMFPTWEERAKDFDAVPQRLGQAGWSTGVVSDYAGDIFGRIDLGFTRVDTPSFDFRQLIRQRALERETPLLPLLHSQLGRRMFPVMRELNDAADPMLLAEDVGAALRGMRKQESPFFLTVFFSTAHFPYAAPSPYYAKYTRPQYRGRFKYHKPVGLGSEAPPDAEDITQIRALYDGAVTAIDDAVARVLRTLRTLDLEDKTIIVVTADHGETLYDHGHGQGHGDHMFGDESTHVPLVVYDPRQGSQGRREMRIVRDVDIAPTLYDLTGVAPPSGLDGRSLAPALRGDPIESRFAYAESELWFTEDIPQLPPEMRIPYPGIMALTELDSRHNAEIVLRKEMLPITLMARHRMVRDERWKLVYVPTRTGVKYVLFDTENDPHETKDVAAAQADVVNRMKTELWKWMLEDPLMEQKDGWLVPRHAGGGGAK